MLSYQNVHCKTIGWRIDFEPDYAVISMTMKNKSLALLVLGLGLPALCPAQNWTSYTNINPIHSLLAEGSSIWAATEGGVLWYATADTTSVRIYTNVDGLPATDITCLGQGSHGRLYFGTAGSGLAILDSTRSHFTRVTSRDQNIISDSINTILCQGNYVFLGSPGGLSFFDGTFWRSFSSPPYPMGHNVFSLAWRNDSLFIGSDGGLSVSPLAGLTGPNHLLWHRYTNIGIGDSAVHSLLTADSEVMAGTGRGLSRLQGGIWTELANLGRQVRDLEQQYDTVYMATSSGVWRWAGGTASDISSGLPSLDVRSLAIINNSWLWAGTAQGLARWDGATWKPFRQNCIPSNNVTRVAAGPDGSVWLGHWLDFASRLTQGGQVKTYPHPRPGVPVTSLAVDGWGRAWYGLAWGDTLGRSCVLIDPQGKDTVLGRPLIPPTCGIYDIEVEASGRLFLAMRYHNVPNYIVEIAPEGQYRWIADPNPSGTYLKPMALARDDGGLWVGTLELGLYRYDLASGLWLNFRKADGLADNNIKDVLAEPSGEIWVATENGLDRCSYDPQTRRLAISAHYTTANSPILSNNVNALARDRSGNRWVATDRGLNMISWDNRWTAFTADDIQGNGSRLLSDLVRGLAVRPQGAEVDDILIATSRGLSLYRHKENMAGETMTASVSPNPLRPASQRTLMLSHLPDRASIALFTLDGRKLGSWLGPDSPAHILYIDTAGLKERLTSGLYLLSITGRSGKAQVLKLVVMR